MKKNKLQKGKVNWVGANTLFLKEKIFHPRRVLPYFYIFMFTLRLFSSYDTEILKRFFEFINLNSKWFKMLTTINI